MSINVNVKRKFNINGKEYSSTDEMPADVREIFQKAMAAKAGSGQPAGGTVTHTRIVFNGTEYESIDKMPQDVRHLYETVLKATESGAAPPGIDMQEIRRAIFRGWKSARTGAAAEVRSPPKVEPTFSPRTLIVIAMVVALLFLMYYLSQHH